MFFSTPTETGEHFFSTVMVRGKVEANLALSVVETPAKGEVPHGVGGKGCTKQCQILDGSGSSASTVISTVGSTAVETAKAMLPFRWGLCPVIR